MTFKLWIRNYLACFALFRYAKSGRLCLTAGFKMIVSTLHCCLHFQL